MDLQKLIARMDQIEAKGMNEAITMKDVQAAVGQEKDEQKRANILNDLAWKEKLPGLYDPVSGYFIRKQSPTDNNQISIAATAREADTQALAAMGLVPSTAKTSALGGLVGTGKLSNTTDQNKSAEKTVKDQSAKVYGGQASDAFIKDIIPKITALLDKAEKEAAGSGSPMAGVKETMSFNSGIAKALAESLGFTLKEGAMEELAPLIQQISDIDDPASLQLLKPLQDRYQALMNKQSAGAQIAKPPTGTVDPNAGEVTDPSTRMPGAKPPTGTVDPNAGEVTDPSTRMPPAAGGNKPAVSTQGAESSAKFKAEKLARLKEITAKLQASASRAPGKGAAAAAPATDVDSLKAALAKVPASDPISSNARPKEESRLSEAEKYAALRDRLLMIETRVDEGPFDIAKGAWNVGKNFFGGLGGKMAQGTTKTAAELTASQAATNAARVAAGKKALSAAQLAQQAKVGIGTANAATGAAKFANRAGTAIAKNPIKTALGATAAGAGAAYALSGKPGETPPTVPGQTGTPVPGKTPTTTPTPTPTPTPGATDVDDIKALTTEIDAIKKELMGDDGSAFQDDPEIQKAIADAEQAAGGAAANQKFSV